MYQTWFWIQEIDQWTKKMSPPCRLALGTSRPCRCWVAGSQAGGAGQGRGTPQAIPQGLGVRFAQPSGYEVGRREAGRASVASPVRHLYAQPGSMKCLLRAAQSPAGFHMGHAVERGGHVQGGGAVLGQSPLRTQGRGLARAHSLTSGGGPAPVDTLTGHGGWRSAGSCDRLHSWGHRGEGRNEDFRVTPEF